MGQSVGSKGERADRGKGKIVERTNVRGFGGRATQGRTGALEQARGEREERPDEASADDGQGQVVIQRADICIREEQEWLRVSAGKRGWRAGRTHRAPQ